MESRVDDRRSKWAGSRLLAVQHRSLSTTEKADSYATHGDGGHCLLALTGRKAIRRQCVVAVAAIQAELPHGHTVTKSQSEPPRGAENCLVTARHLGAAGRGIKSF